MTKSEKDLIINKMYRYSIGEEIEHSTMRVTVAKALEIIYETADQLAEAEDTLETIACENGGC
ncbi:UNVERIFIED_CONTAM: hypothetical protein ABIC26_002583 [Paenibacillus sp. PvR008]